MNETENKRPAEQASIGLVDLTGDDEEKVLHDTAIDAKRRKTDHNANNYADSRDNSSDKPLDLAEKRRLAAEAAMKRLERRS